MPDRTLDGYTLDAAPDRIDLRDRPYQPRLVSLPGMFPDETFIEEYFKEYSSRYVLDQGKNGACTGYGLSAVINYLVWKQSKERKGKGRAAAKLETVSPAMLYHMAQLYDEWTGEDYEGSSCRGAMKGWHHHGACTVDFWPEKKGSRPGENWQTNAAQRPLGAYFRIDKNSITDLHSAIVEVGAVFVSAAVHEGWKLKRTRELPLIPLDKNVGAGGHAFALVGYTKDGFIVQNSWGKKWGYDGFAVLSYEDWIANGTDAWVAVLGAPVELPKEYRSARTRTTLTLRDAVDTRATWFWQSHKAESKFLYQHPEAAPISESAAYEYTVVLGNNGTPENRFVTLHSAEEAVEEVCYSLPKAWLEKKGVKKLAIYGHGGLNDEEASLKRIEVMAPYFLQNSIYPVFVTWRTGFLESIEGIIDNAVTKFFGLSTKEMAAGFFKNLGDQIKEAKDRTIEVASEDLLVKAVWVQIKKNAEAAGTKGGGLDWVTASLAKLKGAIPDVEFHLLGHSAGSILLGYLLKLFKGPGLKATSCSLFAPACSLDFAVEHYAKAIDGGTLLGKPDIEIMSMRQELRDTVGPYGKSLLYLVSRALEDYHKRPLLGMEAAWRRQAAPVDTWDETAKADFERWNASSLAKLVPTVHPEDTVSDGQEKIRLAHGSFDNDVAVITKVLNSILSPNVVQVPVESLHGF
jgi:hypothetical protein